MSILSYDEFMKINGNNKLLKLFPKSLQCYDLHYEENKSYHVDNFDDTECSNGIHMTQSKYLMYWLSNRTNSYFICEILPDKNARFVISNYKIKTNICNIDITSLIIKSIYLNNLQNYTLTLYLLIIVLQLLSIYITLLVYQNTYLEPRL